MPEACRDDLANRISIIRSHLAAGDLPAAALEAAGASERFSASADLRTLRREVLSAACEAMRAAESETARLAAEARFDEARRLLSGLRSVFSGAETPEGESDRAGGSPEVRALDDLLTRVDSQAAVFEAHQAECSAKLETLDLAGAAAVLERLQESFPSPEGERLARSYRDLAEFLDSVRGVDAASLVRLLRSGDDALPEERVEIAKLRRRCDLILSTLAPVKVPRLAEVEEIRARLQEATEVLLARRARLVEALESAGAARRLDEKARALEALARISARTHVLPPGEDARLQAAQAETASLVEQARSGLEEANRLHREGRRPQALAAYRAVEALAPGLFPEASERIRSEADGPERDRRVLEDLRNEYRRLLEGECAAPEARGFFRLVRGLEGERQARPELHDELARKTRDVLARSLDEAAARLAAEGDPGRRRETLTAAADTVLVGAGGDGGRRDVPARRGDPPGAPRPLRGGAVARPEDARRSAARRPPPGAGGGAPPRAGPPEAHPAAGPAPSRLPGEQGPPRLPEGPGQRPRGARRGDRAPPGAGTPLG